MKKMLSKAMAIALSLTILVSAAMFVPKQASANVYGPDRIINIKTQYAILKDYNKAYARNKELWKAQRTDNDAIEKNKIGTDDKDIIALAKKITASSKDDYSKMRAIHDWMATNIYYDYPAYRGEVIETGNVASAQSPFVVVDRKRAICGGYAVTTVALLRAVGIPAKTIGGVVTTDSKVGHAWSQAWLSSEKRWVIMDTTWDSGNKYDNGKYAKGSMRTKYFDISLAELSHSHLITSTSEVWNKIMWYPNIEGQPNTYTSVAYMSGLTWKNPGIRPGYKFAGWFKDKELKTAWNFNKDKAATDVNLYAKWTPETYTVKFDSNGGTPVASVKTTYNTRLTRPKEPTRAGYIFAGWTFKKNGTEFWNFIKEPYISTVKGNLTLYASWQKPYTITFDSCGGTQVKSNKTGLNGKVLQPNETPKREGYTFAGWYYKKNAKDADRPVYFGEALVKKDTTLYARWTPGGSKTGSTTTKTPTPTQVPTPTPAPTPGAEVTPGIPAQIENGTYSIKPASNTNLSIDIPSSSKLNGIGLVYYTSTGNNNQKFNITKAGDNQYTITAVHSGKNWTSAGIKGGRITQSDVNNNSNQKFTITVHSDGTYRIQDSEGFFVGVSGGKIAKNISVLLWTEATDETQKFIFTKLEAVSTPTETPTPTPKPTPEPTPKPTPKPTETPEESLVPSKVESITRATDTNKNTIKDGWYYLVCQNNYIRVNNTEALLTKEDYANQFYIRHLGGTLYSIRSMFGTYLSTEDIAPRSGDKVPTKLIQEENSQIAGWVINIDPKTNVCTIHPLNNKNLVISGSSNNKVVLADATKAKDAAKITLVPRE